MASTIKDVAKLAKVSIASVSKALNGEKGVGAETRERIMNAAKILGYAPNARAVSFSRQEAHAIIVTSILVFINCWNEYLFASTFLTGKDLYTLASGLYALQSNNLARNWPQFAAASLFISLPVLIVFFLMQRYMVSGLTAGGVKE